jgi:hypothetical protein
MVVGMMDWMEGIMVWMGRHARGGGGERGERRERRHGFGVVEVESELAALAELPMLVLGGPALVMGMVAPGRCEKTQGGLGLGLHTCELV